MTLPLLHDCIRILEIIGTTKCITQTDKKESLVAVSATLVSSCLHKSKIGGAFASQTNNKTSAGESFRGFLCAGWQSSNATVCKTVFHRFESGPSVQTTKPEQHNKRMQTDAAYGHAGDARRHVYPTTEKL